ncbi:DUF4247 domain-containing protein [Actinocorallia aurantiaca]|uniref:DUF4247 domain-containing protein n=1 Tax=Actinocorallia aurantiaca TaxID=46204 RepID=A0ABP6GKI2_9ACTN
MKKAVIGGGILTLIGAIVLLVTLTGGAKSPRDWIAGRFPASGGGYQSGQPPLRTADQIIRRSQPLDRAYDPAGVFLRYPGAVVAVLPAAGGSLIYVDTPERGYARWHRYVNGRWGGPDGRASLFRGGGPGDGK